MRILTTLTAAGMLMLANAAAATAQTLGMTVDRVRGAVTVFDADNDTFLANLQIPNGKFNVADCSILADQSLGFVTSFSNREVWVIDLTGTPALAGGINPIPISDEAGDNTITPDQKFLLVSGRDDQISVVDIASRSEIAPFVAPNRSRFFVAVEACSDGSILATDFLNGKVERLTIDSGGTLAFTGQKMGSIRAVNAACAPDAASAIGVRSGFTFLPPIGLIRSALIPGLATVDDRELVGQGISAAINSAGNRVFVRSTTPSIDGLPPFGTVDVFSYISATGALGAEPSFSFRVDTTSSSFGVDQLALHPDDTKLYVGELFELNVYDASTGSFLTSITAPNMFRPQGVCFAQPVPPTAVEIDVKPDSIENTVNLASAGVIPVAILSSEDFDALTVDPDTVFLAGASVRLAGSSEDLLCHVQDVNNDGYDDLLCDVETAEFMIEEGSDTVELTAETFDGVQIVGTDLIRIVAGN